MNVTIITDCLQIHAKLNGTSEPSGEDFSASSGQVISQQAVGSGSHVMEEDDVEYDTAGNIQAGGDQGLTAIALYDYQAGGYMTYIPIKQVCS